MSTTQRENWIDYAKFFSIFLVVLFHTNPNLDGFTFEFLKLLRMPAFFLIAGFLFNSDKWNNFFVFFKHRFKRLLIPYFWFYIFFYALWLVFGRNLVGGDELNINILSPITEFFTGKPNIILAPYWFITCLFSIQIIFYFLRKIIHSNLILLSLSLVLYYVVLIFDLTNLPWCLDKALLYLPFYSFANILKKTIKNINHNNVTLVITLTATALTILCINTYTTNTSKYLNYLLYVISGLSIMPAYIIFCKYIDKIIGPINLIKYIGENNIITLALQNYIIGFIKIIGIMIFTTNLLTTNYYSINIVITIITIFISMLISIFINKYTPFVIGKINQNK